MWGVITSDKFTNEMVNRTSGANYPAVTDKVVYAYEIPVPPVEEQKRFEIFVKQSDKSKFALQNSIAAAQATKRSLITDIFGLERKE